MPSAVPYQTGLIGLYNQTLSNPGVYVAWDSNTNFNSSFSLIFKGPTNTDYRFPLVVNKYNNPTPTNLGAPVALGAGATYVYCLNQSGVIAYQKSADIFNTAGFIANTSIEPSFTPNTIKVGTINAQEVILVGYSTFFDVLTFSNNTFTKSNGLNYINLCGINTSNYLLSDFEFSNTNLYFSYQQDVYGGTISLDDSNNVILGSASTGIVINASNGLNAPTKKIAVFNQYKLGVIDTNNNIYEFLYEGDINAGETTSEWILNYSISPNVNQNWSSFIYNNFGVIVATDSFNHTVNVITSANVIVKTQNYGTFDGLQYQIVSTTQTTSRAGNIVNTVGSEGTSYLEFNTPDCVVEDPENNIIVGDLNNRLTYIPIALSYIATVPAPFNEFIDQEGEPADIYYIKQSSLDYSQIVSIYPLSGDELLVKSSVLYELNALLKVPVYDEEPVYDYLRQSATLAYGDIVTDPLPKVRITVSTNGGQSSSMFVLNPYVGLYNTLNQSSDSVYDQPSLPNNYPNGLFYRFTNDGKLYFMDVNSNPVSIQEYDTILVSYYVKMFTNAQINNALFQALQDINAQPGLNKFSSVQACPFYFDSTLTFGATYILLRQLLVGLNSRERRLLIQDAEQGTFDAIANLKETAKMYQESYAELLKKLPISVRPDMKTISADPYSMPGSRSRMFRNLFTQGAT